MAITQAQLDTDLAALVTAINGLITAVNNKLATIQPADFTAEDTQIQTASQAVAAELASLNPTPPAP